MHIFFNGWFSGFFNKDNPGLHVEFFLELFEKVYNEKCFVGTLENSSHLCEFDMLIGSTSKRNAKSWIHTYLFNGESTMKCNKDDYTCVLWGERNHKNVINVPLFVPYIYTNKFVELLEHKEKREDVPEKDVCVFVSNPRGIIRNKFLEKLEKKMHITYAGRYKNNIGIACPAPYNTKEFSDFVSKFKFVISMENSREDTYITEKVIHGLRAKTIPVYWGSTRVHQYINNERILELKDGSDSDIDNVIQKMLMIKSSDSSWKNIVNSNVFPNNENKLTRTMEDIARDIRCLLNPNYWKHISRIYCVSNPKFEPERCKMLHELFKKEGVHEDFITYISPTYKHTITQEIYNKNISNQLVVRMGRQPMKKGELSLFLNYKNVLEDVEKNYKDGLFFIFESDAMIGKEIKRLNKFLEFIRNKEWDLIHIGYADHGGWGSNGGSPVIRFNTGFRMLNIEPYNNELIRFVANNTTERKKYIEDLSDEKSEFRLIRTFHTRCMDSFLWKYNSIVEFLNFMNTEKNYGVPFDYYMCHFLENNIKFKHYWTIDEFFKQGSNLGLIPTTLQN